MIILHCCFHCKGYLVSYFIYLYVNLGLVLTKLLQIESEFLLGVSFVNN
jgi:hypothetical protein